MAAPTVADPGDHVYARILTYRSVVGTGDPWDIIGGDVKATASTSVTVTGVTTTVADTLIVQAVARENDSAAAAFSAQANSNLTGIVERSDAGTTQGNGGGIGVWDGVKATAGATGNTTATVTNSINAFLTIALKPLLPPTVAKSFSPATIGTGGTSTLTITLSNANTTSITGAAFSDIYPANVTNTATPGLTNTCGGTATGSANGSSLTLSGGTIPANGSCTVTVAVTSAVAGSYLNNTGAVTTANAGSGTAATATLTVLTPPTVAKSFSPATVGTGGTSTLTVTLSNANATAITGAAFTDTYPANLLNTATPGAATTCTGGTATAAANGSSLALSGGTIPASGSCTVTVAVTSAVAGSYLNNTGAVTTTNGGSGTAATATLTVTAPTVAKSFSPATIANNGTSTLNITLSNATATAFTGAAFTDVYPAGLLNAATLNTTNSCGGTVTAAAAGGSLALNGGTIPANGSCTVTVAVTSAVAGSYLNNTGPVTTTNGGTGTAATAILAVNAPTVAKSFSPATIAINGTSTLNITLSNATATAFTGAAFTDTYPANVTNTGTPGLTNTCGGTATAAANGSSLALSGGTIPANGSCTVTVAVTSAVAGSYLNNTGAVTTTNSGPGQAATATLTVLAAPTVAKGFSPAMIGTGGTSTLTVTLSNANATAITGAAFTDTYPANVTNTGTPGLTNTCGGTATAAANGSSLALSGGRIPASGSCTVTVAVTSAVAGSYLNSTGSVTTTNAGSGAAATATLTVLTPPTVAKGFSPATIGNGGTSTLTVTLSNANATAITSAAFSDIYPANVTNTGTPGLTNTCGGTAIGSANGSSLALSGGTIPANGSCSITVAVTSAVAGSYLNNTGAVTTANAGSGTAATATLTVTAPTVAKSFSPATIALNGTSTLTITLSNATATAFTGAAFTDVYPADLLNAATLNTTNSCGGTVTAAAAGGSLALSGGTIPANSSCTVTVAVTSAVAGSYLNNTGPVTTTNGGTGTAATAILAVNAPTVAKSFSPATIAINGTSTLNITLSNATATAFTSAAFTDTYPANLLNAATLNTTNSCGGTVTAAAAGGSLALSGGTIPANGSCTVTVAVTSAVAGSYLNNTGAVTTANSGAGVEATATLTVLTPPTVAKSFSPASIGTGGSSTLTITLTNANATAITGAAFTDTYPANLLNTATPGAATTCTGGTATAAANGSSLALSAGTIPASGSCTVTVAVTSATAGSYLNSTGSVTTTNAGSGTAATATLTVTDVSLNVTKTTSTPAVTNTASGTTATYTVTVVNSGTTNATGVVLTDSLAAGFSYNGGAATVTLNGTALATTAYTETAGVSPTWTTNPAGGFTINAGATLVVTFTANVASSVADGTYNNSASVTSANASSIANFDGAVSTTENVIVTSAVLAVTKTTSTPAVTNTASGTTATYTITVTNTGTANATGVKVSDTLAAGFTYASTSSVTVNGATTTAYTASGTTTASWDTNPAGGFTINVGQKLVITFVANVSSAVAPGTYNNSASATSTNAKTISNFDGAANTSDDVTVSAPVGVSLYGTAYNDANHNLQLDGGESGTGLTLYAKLVPSAGGSALQAVAVNPSTGAYTLVTVTPGNYSIVLDDNNVLTDTTPTVPVGWIGTEMPDFRRTNVQVSSTELQNLNFGLFNGGKLSGFVFADLGTGAGTANNGIKDGAETGIAGVTVKVTNAAGTSTYDSTVTSADGGYTLWIPSAAVASSLKVVELNLGGYLSTGGAVGNTGGSYDRPTDTVTFTNVTGTVFAGVNFADVAVNRFAPNGQQSGLPGNVVFYAHRFNAGSGGSVSFGAVSAGAWLVVIYRDLNCNGQIDAGDGIISALIAVAAGDQLCIVVKVSIPPGTALGVQDNITAQASFTYTNAAPSLAATLFVADATTVGVGSAGLVLTKTTDKATATIAEIITYTVVYQNNSSTPISSIVISDATPAYTTFIAANCGPLPAAISACTLIAAPAVGGVGPIRWQLTGTLSPASSGQVGFSVKVDN